jgi:hypothetical protein
VVQWQLLIVVSLLQASLNNDNTKPSYWLHEAVARGDLKVRKAAAQQMMLVCTVLCMCPLHNWYCCSVLSSAAGLHMMVCVSHAFTLGFCAARITVGPTNRTAIDGLAWLCAGMGKRPAHASNSSRQ